MKTKIATLTIITIALFVAPLVSNAIINDDAGPAYSASTDYAMVQLRAPPLASYDGSIPGLGATKPAPGHKLDLNSPAAQAYAAYLASQRSQAVGYWRSKAPNIQVIRDYSVTFNGFAIKLNGESFIHAWRAPGVISAQPSRLFQPTMNVSPGLIGAPTLWGAVGGQSSAGLGIKVGVIDTGVKQDHPFINDPSLCTTPGMPSGFPKGDLSLTNCKVIVAKVFQSLTNDNAADQRGHGSHVSGTIAGVAGTCTTVPVVICGLSGIAPKAFLGNYNVFPGNGFFPGCAPRDACGSSFEHDIAMAVEEAVIDGMDVINMSLGGSPRPNDLLAGVVNSAVDAGVVAAVAAGNSGPSPGTVSSPGTAEKAITAGASTNPHFLGIPVTVPGLGTFGAALGDFTNFGTVNATYRNTTPTNGCTAIAGNLTGEIALIRRGTCTFTTKIRNAQAAGAIGVIVYNNVVGDPVAMGHDGTSPFPTIPAVMVSNVNGAAMAAISPNTASVDGTMLQEFITTNADIIAGFSSRGPPPVQDPSPTQGSSTHDKIKPDVTAPGVNVLSSVIGTCTGGCYAFFQGTSMATPHVAGSAAVLVQQHPGWSPEQIKSALVNTAKRPVFHQSTGAPLANPMDRGGGRIDLAAASMVSATLVHVSVSLGTIPPNSGWTKTETFTLTSVSPGTYTYTLTLSPGLAGLSLSTGSITLGPGASAQFSLTLTVQNIPKGDYFGDIVLTGGTVTLRAPYWVRIDQPDPQSTGIGISPR